MKNLIREVSITIIKKKTVATTSEEITVSVDDRQVLIFSEKEKEIETADAILKAADKVLNLNSKNE